MSLGRMMVGGAANGNALARNVRRDGDFYPTPPECTIALLRAEETRMPMQVWEPACGDGAMARVLQHYGRSVVATDLVDRGHGEHGKNFLFQTELRAPAIVTNPPFKLAAQFIEKAQALSAVYCALLLKSTFFHAASRAGMFARHRPARIYALTWRPDFLEQNAPTMECVWVVWDGTSAVTHYDLLSHPHAARSAPMPLFCGV